MTKLNHLLRRLTPWQIVVAGVAAWIFGMALVMFGLVPLVASAFLPLGQGPAALAGLVTSIIGGVAVGWFVPRPFLKAYFQRKLDDEMQRVVLAYAEARRNG